MRVLITGATKGIGRELVREFANNTENYIVAIARSSDILESLKNEFNNIHIYSIDFLSAQIEDELDKLIGKESSGFDIIINNAGQLINKPFEQTSTAEILNLFQVNYIAPILIIKKVIEVNGADRALHVVNIGSMGGVQGSVKFPGLSAYSSSKAALANLTECLAEEYKDTLIRFNCLALGSVNTDMLKDAFPGFEGSNQPNEMAKFIKDFALNAHKFYNGKVLPVATSTP